MLYKRFNKIFKVNALKSVVLSAGTLNTPKILMLSGIGPAHQLISLKVKTKFKLLLLYIIKKKLYFINVKLCLIKDPCNC